MTQNEDRWNHDRVIIHFLFYLKSIKGPSTLNEPQK